MGTVTCSGPRKRVACNTCSMNHDGDAGGLGPIPSVGERHRQPVGKEVLKGRDPARLGERKRYRTRRMAKVRAPISPGHRPLECGREEWHRSTAVPCPHGCPPVPARQTDPPLQGGHALLPPFPPLGGLGTSAARAASAAAIRAAAVFARGVCPLGGGLPAGGSFGVCGCLGAAGGTVLAVGCGGACNGLPGAAMRRTCWDRDSTSSTWACGGVPRALGRGGEPSATGLPAGGGASTGGSGGSGP